MELKEALAKLAELQKKLYAYHCASSSLYLDATTTAPKDTAEGRGVALGILAGERHKLFSAPEVGELLDFLWGRKDELEHPVRRQVEELRRSYAQLTRIPADEYMEYAMLTNEASDVWHRAKEQSDFELFRPVLEKLVAFNIKFAGYYDSSKAPYDAPLVLVEQGVIGGLGTVVIPGEFDVEGHQLLQHRAEQLEVPGLLGPVPHVAGLVGEHGVFHILVRRDAGELGVGPAQLLNLAAAGLVQPVLSAPQEVQQLPRLRGGEQLVPLPGQYAQSNAPSLGGVPGGHGGAVQVQGGVRRRVGVQLLFQLGQLGKGFVHVTLHLLATRF